MATAGQDGRSVLYDLTQGTPVRVLAPTPWTAPLDGVTFDPQGQQVMLTTYRRDRYFVYQLADGALLYTLYPEKEVAAFGFDAASGDPVLLYQDGSARIARLFASPEALLDYAR